VKEYKLIIPSDLEQLEKVHEFIYSICQENQISDDDEFKINLAVSEAVSNSIIHGNRNEYEKNVEINFKLMDNEITISISDEGEGFDIESAPDPTTEENLLKESGRGIFLIKKYMHSVYIDQNSSTNTLIIKYHLR
jgi:serine/threonine-protein kinase RsbW